ncbi:hypothetical protein D3C84_1065120 [compost metagenome]
MLTAPREKIIDNFMMATRISYNVGVDGANLYIFFLTKEGVQLAPDPETPAALISTV